ncbi:MAG TPA: aldo/keto reductase [Candidatus Acidoferrales bacterium]|nr:aldo/keto reductase [Candidatus Acidoferrales bacterium]
MRDIAIPGIAMRVPVIGFGCSALSNAGEKKALQLLETAFDAGVRHFDVARYYGYGESEGILGKFAKSRRAQITITTKFGIEPPRRTNALRVAMQAGRQLVKYVPAARGFLQKRAQGLVKNSAFNASAAQTSLETSLRELNTDYVDFFLLHDYTVSEELPDELGAFLTQAVKSGKIRHFGLGTGLENILRALDCQPELCHVLQFENSAVTRNLEKVPQGGRNRLTVTHGALSASYNSISGFLKTKPQVVKDWSTQLAIDCSGDEIISALMLNYAVHANPNGLVLFSSRDATRVRKNVGSVLDPDISPAQIERFAQLVERDFMLLAK